MSCQKCDLPLIPGEPACGNCGFPVPLADRQRPSAVPGPFPAGAKVYLAEQPYRGGRKTAIGTDQFNAPGSADGGEAAVAPSPPPATAARTVAWSRIFGDFGLSRDRPPEFSSTARWLLAGVIRNQRGMIGALLVAWSNLTIAVFLAVAGLVTGAIAGFWGTTPQALDLPVPEQILPLRTFEAGGTIGALGGALAGFAQGFVAGVAAPWWDMFDGDSFTVAVIVIGQVFAGLLLGLAYLLIVVSCEHIVLRARGARRPSRREAELILPIMHESAEFMGLKGLPAVLIRDSRDVSAFAAARHIVLSRGLLEEFNYDRAVVAGVVSHVLAHWNNADPVGAAITRGVGLPLYFVYGVAARIMSAFPHPLVRLLVWAAAWPVLLVVGYLVVPLQGREQRAAEKRADQGAVLARHGAGLRRFLVTAGTTVDGGRSRFDDAARRVHPPVELRLEELEERGQAYRLPDREAPPRPLPVEDMGSRASRAEG